MMQNTTESTNDPARHEDQQVREGRAERMREAQDRFLPVLEDPAVRALVLGLDRIASARGPAATRVAALDTSGLTDD